MTRKKQATAICGPMFAVVVCFAALLLDVASMHAGGVATNPDVFLVTIDTLRADHVHCYNNSKIQTPDLDNLARDGILFLNAFTVSPITNSSHASILTGLLPGIHGVTAFRDPLSPVHPSMAELLRLNGYQTSAFIGSMVLDTNMMAPGFDQGFDFYDNFPESSLRVTGADELRRPGKDVIKDAENWLDSHSSGHRFVWVHLYDVHAPYKSPLRYSQKYGNGSYDGAVAYTDSLVGEYLAYLKKRRWYRDSLVIIVADHGEGLGEHEEDMHGTFLYDATMHVPLIIKLPKNEKAGPTVPVQVRTTDILPTVLQLLRIPAPAKLSGESLVSYWSGGSAQSRPAIGETDYPLTFGWAPLRSVRANGFKLIEAPRPELYDIQVDPKELNNIYSPWNPRVEELRQILANAEPKSPKSISSEATPAGGTVDELNALGYWTPADSVPDILVRQPSLLPDPKDKVAELRLLQHAGTALSESRLEAGRQALEEALQMDPSSATLLSRLVGIELQAGQRDRGGEFIELEMDIRNKDANAAYRMGNARENAGDLYGAQEALEVSLGLDSRSATRLLLGEVLLRRHELKEAEVQFRSVLLQDPQNTEALAGLAKLQ